MSLTCVISPSLSRLVPCGVRDGFFQARPDPPSGLLGGARCIKDNLPAKVELRARVLQCREDTRLTYRQLAAKFRIPLSTVGFIIKNNSAVVKQRGGARRNDVPPEVIKRFIQLVTGRSINGWREGGMGLRQAVLRWNADDDEKHTVSRASAYRWLRKDHFFPYVPLVGGNIQAPNIVQRRNWYTAHHRHKPSWWYCMCFSDSTPVNYVHIPNARNERVWARRGERVHPCRKRRRQRKTLHTYGVLTKWGMVGPFFVEGFINAHRYITSILPKMLAGIQAIFAANNDTSSWTFMQDGAGPHTANRTQEWLERSAFLYWSKKQWPGCSPDLNPIEGLWSIMQAAVTPKGTDQPLPTHVLKQRVTAWFAAGQKDICRRALRGMQTRCQQLLENEFEAIQH